ncbi:hypothetical protein PHLCEN_2v10950 [Hermanssonia centrifuga]|uniref:Uncharacterized protein n=1 Tax=Hermanssonia centrifuga TaxID=98765 RepID=A0A2R6NLC7_9APHY|nr:hypothetical protein PHLCEN_2v10950 [Hermanssonia centrifuga]
MEEAGNGRYGDRYRGSIVDITRLVEMHPVYCIVNVSGDREQWMNGVTKTPTTTGQEDNFYNYGLDHTYTQVSPAPGKTAAQASQVSKLWRKKPSRPTLQQGASTSLDGQVEDRFITTENSAFTELYEDMWYTSP